MADKKLSHVDARGEAHMVDVGDKAPTRREARAQARLSMDRRTRDLIESGEAPKGSVFGAARLAGIQAAKRCDELIPLCHSLPLDVVTIEFSWKDAPQDRAVLEIEALAAVTAKTGVEMEALTAASVAALTVYDMVKAADRGLEIESVLLLEKTGGRSGTWRRG